MPSTRPVKMQSLVIKHFKSFREMATSARGQERRTEADDHKGPQSESAVLDKKMVLAVKVWRKTLKNRSYEKANRSKLYNRHEQLSKEARLLKKLWNEEKGKAEDLKFQIILPIEISSRSTPTATSRVWWQPL